MRLANTDLDPGFEMRRKNSRRTDDACDAKLIINLKKVMLLRHTIASVIRIPLQYPQAALLAHKRTFEAAGSRGKPQRGGFLVQEEVESARRMLSRRDRNETRMPIW